MTRKICVLTGTRAEYGLLRWLMADIKEDPMLQLQVVATGAHLSPEFGLTYREIEGDGFQIDRKVEMLLSSDSPIGITKSIGLGVLGCADAFAQLRPDLLVLLGDRYETFAAATAALVAQIPIAHIHGGEITEGAIDDAFRHSLTKMSHLHFVAAEEYRKRVIQLGEEPKRVFNVGGLGIDAISRVELMSRAELERSLDFRFMEKNLMVTFHPATLENVYPETQMKELLSALAPLNNVGLIITLPNADTGGRVLIKMINDFVCEHPNARAFQSLGQKRYLSCLAFVDGVVGNSSSGLLEVPSYKKGTINIGSRQDGRLSARSVINCAPDAQEISQAIERMYSSDFQSTLKYTENPYGQPGASKKIVDLLHRVDYPLLLNKRFYNLVDSTFGSEVIN